jgi:hypothetical protein
VLFSPEGRHLIAPNSNGTICLYIDPLATAYLDAFTLQNTKGNTPDNIYGTYNANPL